MGNSHYPAYIPSIGQGINCTVDDDCPSSLVCYVPAMTWPWSEGGNPPTWCGCRTGYAFQGDACTTPTPATQVQMASAIIQLIWCTWLLVLAGKFLGNEKKKVQWWRWSKSTTKSNTIVLCVLANIVMICDRAIMLSDLSKPEQYQYIQLGVKTAGMRYKVAVYTDVLTWLFLLLACTHMLVALYLGFAWVSILHSSSRMKTHVNVALRQKLVTGIMVSYVLAVIILMCTNVPGYILYLSVPYFVIIIAACVYGDIEAGKLQIEHDVSMAASQPVAGHMTTTTATTTRVEDSEAGGDDTVSKSSISAAIKIKKQIDTVNDALSRLRYTARIVVACLFVLFADVAYIAVFSVRLGVGNGRWEGREPSMWDRPTVVFQEVVEWSFTVIVSQVLFFSLNFLQLWKKFRWMSNSHVSSDVDGKDSSKIPPALSPLQGSIGNNNNKTST